MSPSVRRGFTWAVLVAASLVIVGVFLQVYFIAAYLFSGLANQDALDTHTNLGGIVHLLEVLALLAAVGAYWKAWKGLILPAALAVVGTVQLGFAEGDEEWVSAFHGLLALVVLILAHAVVMRCVRDLGLGRHGGAATPH